MSSIRFHYHAGARDESRNDGVTKMEQKEGLNRIISMARQPRTHIDGAVYHVMARGIDGHHLFAAEREQALFYQSLRRIKKAKPFGLLGHCLMSNHFHLVVQALQTTLSEIMHLLQTRFAVIYNQNMNRAGHVFQGRYLPLLIRDDAYLMTVLRYVHLNPVAAGLVEFPEQWINSGHNEIMGLAQPYLVDSGLALEFFGDDPAEARERYRRFVYSRLLDPDQELPSYEPPGIETTPPPRESAMQCLQRRDFAELAAAQALAAGLEVSEVVAGRKRQATAARRMLIVNAFRGGYRIAEIARFLDVSLGYVSRIASGVEK